MMDDSTSTELKAWVRPAFYLLAAFSLGWIASKIVHAPDASDLHRVEQSRAELTGKLLRDSQRLIAESKLEEATQAAQQGLMLDPDNPGLRNNLAVATLMKGEVLAAHQILAELVKDEPDFVLAANNLRWAEGERKKLQDKVVELTSSANSAEAGATKTQALWEIARLHKQLGDHAGALSIYEQIIAADEKNVGAINNAGVELMALGRPQDALRQFQAAAELQPDIQLYSNNIGWARGEIQNSAD